MTLPEGATLVGSLTGGDINEAYHVLLADGRDAFVKTRDAAAPGDYDSEAEGLRWLAEPAVLQVPDVLEVGARHLALQWIEHGSLDADGADELGRGLARLHAAGAPVFGDPFGRGDSVLGSLRLPNAPLDDWPSFYARRRLAPLLELAQRHHAISERGAGALERVIDRIGELCGPAEPPARLHGDLWGGNVLAGADGRPWLIDPAAYGGHREIDLAMLRLFGAPSERVFAAYEEVAPLADGWPARVELWQLAPLLVHAVLFGGSYCEAAARVAISYGGG